VRDMLGVQIGPPVEGPGGEVIVYDTCLRHPSAPSEVSTEASSEFEFSPEVSAMEVSAEPDLGSYFGFDGFGLGDMQWMTGIFGDAGLDWADMLPCLTRGRYTSDEGYAILPTPWSSSPWKFAVMVVWRSKRQSAYQLLQQDMQRQVKSCSSQGKLGAAAMILTASKVKKFGLASLCFFLHLRCLSVHPTSSQTSKASLALSLPQSSMRRMDRTRSDRKDYLRGRVSRALERLGKDNRDELCSKVDVEWAGVSKMPMLKVEMMAAELGIMAEDE